MGNGEVYACKCQNSGHSRLNAPTCTMKKELMRALGFVGYYHSFCYNFSSIDTTLTGDLLKAEVKYIWSSNCALAFDNVKSL